MSAMRETMAAQPKALERIFADRRGLDDAARRLEGRRVLVVGTGTSWHAANQGVSMLRRAGLEAWPVPAVDAALGDPFPTADDALILLSHRGTKHFTSEVLVRARAREVPTVVISRQGNPDSDLDTVPNETSSAFTASHLGALLRLAQLAERLGADLGALADVPGAVAAELANPPAGVAPPRRLLQYAGVGINAWTAAEGALKISETARVASEGLACETVLHGPAVALGADDGLVCLDGGEGSDRLLELGDVVAAHGATVHRFARTELGGTLSIFPLTVIVQKIAVEAAELLGTNPDRFGRDLPEREAAWSGVVL
jgi:glucosamine--fructose-6-phosphate aminotransferase (isomerizing)